MGISSIVTPIAPDTWKVRGQSNFFARKVGDAFVLIDTGARSDRRDIEWFATKLIPPERVRAVLFTHMHLDHVGNYDLFPKAALFVPQEELDDFRRDPAGAVLDPLLAERLKGARLVPIGQAPLHEFGLEMIKTPGHTRGSVCFWDAAHRVLFSGDTIFDHGVVGRVDLPTSAPGLMEASLRELVKYPFAVLAAGHDVEPTDTPR